MIWKMPPKKRSRFVPLLTLILTVLLLREICRAEGIPFQYSLNVRVDALRKINAIAGIYEKDLDFAVALFAKDIRRRYQWLERQVEKHSGEHLEDQEQLRELLDLVKGMKK